MTFIDQIGHTMVLDKIPKKIVSVVPSQTELLYSLGLDEEVVGITKFCVHPNYWYKNKTRIGGTKKLHLDKILALKPDLILANKEENTPSEIEYLQAHFPTYTSNIFNLEDALNMIIDVGQITGRKEIAQKMVKEIKQGFKTIKNTEAPQKIAYVIWQNPIMTAGKETYINSILEKGGFKNVFEKGRYPECTFDELRALEPQHIFLSSEPFPFKEKHLELFKKESPTSKVTLVDGEMFSWYGSRLLRVPKYLNALKKSVLTLK